MSSCWPTSKSVQMLGWLSAETARASRRKPRAEGRVAGEVRRQDLDRDHAVQARVAGAVDLAHAPGAQRREDFVRTEPDSAVDRHGERGARRLCQKDKGDYD